MNAAHSYAAVRFSSWFSIPFQNFRFSRNITCFFKILVMVMSSFPVYFFLCNTGSDAPVRFRAVAVGWSRPQTACKEVSTLPLTLQGSGHNSEKMGAVMSFAGLHCVDQVCTFTSSCSVIMLSLSVTD